MGRAPGNDDRGQRRRPAGKTMIAAQGEVACEGSVGRLIGKEQQNESLQMVAVCLARVLLACL